MGDVINDLGLGIFAEVDVVIGCLDNREARLWVNRQCWKATTPWVDSGIQEIQGVVKVFVPPDSACYECAMTARDYQLLNVRYSCPMLRRDQILEGKVPTAPTIASMMAALEVQEALKLIHGLPVAAGSALVFNGVTNQFYSTQLPASARLPEPRDLPRCRSAGDRPATRRPRSCSTSPDRMAGPLTLALERDLVTTIDCPAARPDKRFSARGRPSARRGRRARRADVAGRPELISSVEEGSPEAGLPLAKLGIPPYDIVRVDGAAGSGFFLLAGDRSPVEPLASEGLLR